MADGILLIPGKVSFEIIMMPKEYVLEFIESFGGIFAEEKLKEPNAQFNPTKICKTAQKSNRVDLKVKILPEDVKKFKKFMKKFCNERDFPFREEK